MIINKTLYCNMAKRNIELQKLGQNIINQLSVARAMLKSTDGVKFKDYE